MSSIATTARAPRRRGPFDLGHYAEVYSDLGELLARPPQYVVILLGQRTMHITFADPFEG
jgi:hypothetical protein